MRIGEKVTAENRAECEKLAGRELRIGETLAAFDLGHAPGGAKADTEPPPREDEPTLETTIKPRTKRARRSRKKKT